jgi:hypothetical protein
VLTAGLDVDDEQAILESQLEYERQRTEYYRNLLLQRFGVVQEESEKSTGNLEPIRPRRTILSIRRREIERKRRKEKELTEGEKVFEQELNASN